MNRIEANIASNVADVVRPAANDESKSFREQALPETARAAEEAPVAADDLASAAQQLRKVVEAASGRQLEFQIDEGSEDLLVLIRDKQTEEVIKQVPSEEVLRLREHIDQLVGVIVDETA